MAIVSDSALAEKPIELPCRFHITAFGEYVCELTNITVPKRDSEVFITGTHVDGRGDLNVTTLQIEDANTPYLIPILFETFINMTIFRIYNSNLQEIEIPEVVQLRSLIVQENNITRITRDSFRNQKQLWFVDLPRNGIQEIARDAFETVISLEFLGLLTNNIQQIIPGTYDNLPKVYHIDYTQNALTRLESRLFSNCTSLERVSFDFNQIHEISPSFVSDLPRSVGSVGLFLNSCVSRFLLVDTEENRKLANEALGSCFQNFRDRGSEIVLRFSGPLFVLDRFNNVIGRFE